MPMGVVAAICPFNYPLVLAMGKIGAALITGSCVIVKPSPFTPYSVLKFVEVVKSIFPAGVIQALNGDEKTGPQLCEHPDIQKISFTGSIATGKKIMAVASKTLKTITLELGGNDACIVCPDVDIAVVAPQVAVGAFLNSGQYCLATKRIYVHEDIYQPFLQRLTEVVSQWKTSPSTPDAGNMLGPIQNEMQYGIVKGFYEDSGRNRHRFALGSAEIKEGDHFVIHPAIIDNPPDGSKVVREEAFGMDMTTISHKRFISPCFVNKLLMKTFQAPSYRSSRGNPKTKSFVV
jgi:acyl-CoA reductase-like NAD-dependent aldehyde dehydrogenase